MRNYLALNVVFLISVMSMSVTVFAANSPCEVPFTEMQDPRTGNLFQIEDALNNNSRVVDKFNYRQRFLVADLNTKNSQGQCKGLTEFYPLIDVSNPDLISFPDLAQTADLVHFVQNIQGKFYESPMVQKPIEVVGGVSYCTGQTVSFCEIRNGRPVEVARLAVSAETTKYEPTLYVPLNKTTLRSWALKRDYTEADKNHDIVTGGIEPGKLFGLRYSKYVSGGGWVMPHFVKWDAEEGLETKGYMGLHQLTKGESAIVVPGSPVSHGCFRLSKYGAILNRWWTPFGAKMFIRTTKGLYKKYP